MKVIFVDNPHDSTATEKRNEVMRALTSDRWEAAIKRVEAGEKVTSESLAPFKGEIHVVDFNLLRNVLPISAVPCILILFDELTGAFPAARIEQIVKAGKAAGVPVQAPAPPTT